MKNDMNIDSINNRLNKYYIHETYNKSDRYIIETDFLFDYFNIYIHLINNRDNNGFIIEIYDIETFETMLFKWNGSIEEFKRFKYIVKNEKMKI